MSTVDKGSTARLSRRSFLLSAGALTVSASALAGCGVSRPKESGWVFGEFRWGCTDPDYDEAFLTPVTFPHCAPDLSWWGWDPDSWDRVWVYRCHVEQPGRRERVILHFDGVLQTATVFVNGRPVDQHIGGYLPFEFDLTDQLDQRDNAVAVVVDSRWGLNIPPGRPKPWRPESIDFYQPGGIPRNVEIRRLPHVFVADVHAVPVDVLRPWRRLDVAGELDARHPIGPVSVVVRLVDGRETIAEATREVVVDRVGRVPFAVTLSELGDIRLWDVDDPNLYDVVVSVVSGRRVGHETSTRVGFREARFERDGFFLNGRRLQLFGLNRHEWYPYVGAAMPDRVHRRDAEILKYDLNCNMVRCSHYPQSPAFLDACDELGLLVWEESPGWDYIGDDAWREQVVRNVEDMVRRDRNRPSVIIWGTRLNETENDVELYARTRSAAVRLDGTRATTGAVNSAIVTRGPAIPAEFRDPFRTSPRVQDVFAYNDYLVPKRGALPSLRPPRTNLPYLISEAVGVVVGPSTFRRTDSVRVQARQSLMHAAVHDRGLSDARYCGVLGWCGIDYPSGHGEAVNGVKSPGVLDLFREAKLGAGFYRAQVDPARRLVIEPAFYWSRDTVPGRSAVIWSNCEQLDVYVDGRPVGPARQDRQRFPHLPHPPFLVDLPRVSGDLRIDGRIGGEVAYSRWFSADRSRDRLSLLADDSELRADGVDATRVAVSVVDWFGARRGFARGAVSWSITGPGDLVGDNPLDLDGNAGVGAVWIRTRRDAPGRIVVRASHPRLPDASVAVVAL
ncbi:glycoside hydrolase family 2 protein [Saccharopolyspora rosea]|uniref:glycoside hydrolase family 2 protein n=1 Tax=Saccharopolyspora rosea TaxID=524884 RepID=UPI0021DA2329|nr:glycoside hydrolase family 2 TIM barrel-domain containing protein [Saccharopolyspora rosea]